MKRLAAWGSILVLAVAAVAAADELTVTLGTIHQGLFKGVTNRRFEFQTNHGRKLSESVMNLKTLVMDPPVKAVVTTASGRTTTGTLTGIATGQVQVLDAQGSIVGIPLVQVKSVTVASDWQRTVADDVEVISHGEVFDPAAVVRRGKVTILHFHEPGSMSSTRQGSYAAVLARDSHGAVALLRVVVADPQQAPVMSALGLTTLPQFWFYSANGALVDKLSERFTDGDLDGALAKARRGGGRLPAHAPAAKGP